MMTRCFATLSLLALCLTAPPAGGTPPATQPARPGLTVSDDGILLRDGQPYRGVGINYFGAFYDIVRPGGNGRYVKGFQILADHDVPFIRFAATPFWPKHYELYLANKAEYFRRFDALVDEAERRGIGLIPSLFWNQMSVCDVVGEPRSAWGDPGSKTLGFMRRYTREVVTRYRDRKAIWAWEFGNEFNLPADLPNAPRHRPKVNVPLGTPATRSADDDITGEVIVTAFTEFATLVRQLDPHRPILSGNSRPRPYAWHNAHEGSWVTDTRAQFAAMLRRDNPDPMDMLSIHLYARPKQSFFPDEADEAELIRAAMAASRELRKPLFIGEFGASRKLWSGRERPRNEALLAAIERYEVPLAAVWVFDYPPQDGQFNIWPENDLAYILDLLRAANRRLSAGASPPRSAPAAPHAATQPPASR
ncbi:MAG: cellulase family glycosylhydrolase [Planctomycetota bacterium]